MKGQFTFEFLGTVVVALLIFAVFHMYIVTQFAGMLPWDNQNYEANFYARRIADQVNHAYTAGDGYESSFELPEQIRGRIYTVVYATQVVEVDIIDLGDVDSYGLAAFTAADVEMYGVGNGTNYVVNTNGTVVVWR